MSKVREKTLSILGGVGGMIALPAACFALRNTGPAARVVFFDYFPIHIFAIFALVALLGAVLGAGVPRSLRRKAPNSVQPRRWPRLKWIALAVVIAWAVMPQLRAFPAHGSVAERDAWARDNIREYPALRRVVAASPEVQRDVGHVVAIAPTGDDIHRFAREMNGDDMHFTLDVIGSKGAGTFFADCTLDSYTVFDWRSGRWRYRGHELRIDKVAARVPQ